MPKTSEIKQQRTPFIVNVETEVLKEISHKAVHKRVLFSGKSRCKLRPKYYLIDPPSLVHSYLLSSLASLPWG
jgi:hypothetical protein